MLERIIKIPGKSFDDLSAEELALMIEADSSLSSEGNDYFSSRALDEFLYSANLKRSNLQALRRVILESIYIDRPNSNSKDIDTEFLRQLARRIREGEVRIER